MAGFTNCTIKIFSFLSYLLLVESVQSTMDFVYNGFFRANLSFYGASFMRSNGMLAITNNSSKLFGHVFFLTPFRLKNLVARKNISDVVTFNTNFVFSIHPKYPGLEGHGFTFLLTPTLNLKDCLPNQYLGLPNITNKSQYATRILAMEFDTIQNLKFQDINDNHVGIDISNLISNISQPAAFYNANNGNDDTNATLILKSGDPFQAWIEYDNLQEMLRVSISPLGMGRPTWSLLSFLVDLAQVLDEYIYIDFSASTSLLSTDHNVHGWSFKIGGRATELDPKKLPMFPIDSNKVVQREEIIVGIVLARITLFILVIFAAVHVLHRIRVEEILEDGAGEHGAERFRYSELYSATRGFREKNLVGSGGFGRVYKGVIRSTGLEVADILIDADLSAKMGDFGLARAYDHGNNPTTTNIIGTLGYMAPELTRTGKATTSTNVFSYGILLLEVVCGRMPIEPHRPAVELVLMDWVKEQHCQGDITRAVDATLDDYNADEVALVLRLGLLCSHSHLGRRSSIRRVVQYLMRDANLSTLPTDIHTKHPKEIMEYSDSYPDVFDPSCSRMTSSRMTASQALTKRFLQLRAQTLLFRFFLSIRSENC